MKIIVFGATGFIGKPLCATLTERGHTVIKADLRRDKDWEQKIQDADVVVNLAGAPLFAKRWTESYKKLILDSRVEGTSKIVEALGRAKAKGRRPTALVNGSAIGFYGDRGDETLDEKSGPGSDFLADVCREWEDAAKLAETQYGLRTVIVRTGVVLGPDGGALAQLLPPFKAFVGGPVGDGRQWFSWIHLDDIVGIFVHAAENASARGILDGTAPHPATNEEFSATLGRVLHRPHFFRVPAFALRALVGGAADTLLTGQKALPKATISSGYGFKFAELENALKDICS